MQKNFLPDKMKNLFQEKAVKIPADCKVSFKNDKFIFEGKLGSQEYDVSALKYTFVITDNSVLVKCWHCNRQKLQLINTVASHIRNYMVGVTVGFKYVLRSVFRHFPIQVSINKEGKEVKVGGFIGSREERVYPIRGESVALPGDLKDTIYIQGININDVSQSAASIISDSLRRKKHDERVFVDGIYIMEKTAIINND